MNKKAPTLRRHRRSGHGYARLDGRQVWFGPYDDPETHQRFARTLAEWIANGRRLPSEQGREEMRVADIVAAYLEFAASFYCKPDGTPTREVENLTDAVRLLLKLYGTLPVHEFGLRQIKTLREQMITDGLTRKTINDRLNRMVRLFGWAAEEELCKSEVYSALRALRSLKRGRSAAREGRRILPVAWEHVEAVLPHVSRPLAGIIVQAELRVGRWGGRADVLLRVDETSGLGAWSYEPLDTKLAPQSRA